MWLQSRKHSKKGGRHEKQTRTEHLFQASLFFKTSIVGQRESHTEHNERNYGKAGDERWKRGGSRCQSGFDKDLCLIAGS